MLRLSCPGAFRRDLMAEMISPFSDDTMLTFRSVSVGGGPFQEFA